MVSKAIVAQIPFFHYVQLPLVVFLSLRMYVVDALTIDA